MYIIVKSDGWKETNKNILESLLCHLVFKLLSTLDWLDPLEDGMLSSQKVSVMVHSASCVYEILCG